MPAALAIMNERPIMTIVAPKAASPLIHQNYSESSRVTRDQLPLDVNLPGKHISGTVCAYTLSNRRIWELALADLRLRVET